jgi:hypothetical protein
MRTALAGLVVLAAVGCAHQAPQLHDPRAPHWIEVASPHFVLRTDLSPRQARAALVDFESVYGTLTEVAFNGDAPRERLDVVLFSDEDRFQSLAPRGASGYFMPRQVDDPEPEPTIAIQGRMLIAGTLVESTQRRFRHELTHRFLEHRVRASLPWLEEGLAQYYSTLRISGSDAVVGTLPNQKLFRVDILTQGCLIRRQVDDRVDLSAVPSVAELLSADFTRFHAPEREFAFYAAAWTFVHMMLNGPQGYAPRFNHFLELLAADTPPADAWRTSFFGVPLWRLEREFRDYVSRPEMMERALTVAVPRAPRAGAVHQLDEGEVHLLLARIRPWDSRANILAAGRELAAARAFAGEHVTPELRYWSALYASRWRHFDEAIGELRAAVAAEPRRARYWLALADVLMQQGPVDGAALDEVIARLLPLANSPQELTFIARYYSERGQVETGLPFARRAVALERGCWECAETLTVLQNLQRTTPPPNDGVYTKPSIF